MPKILQTKIAKWMKVRFQTNEAACEKFNVSMPTLLAWKKDPPKILLEFAQLYEENMKNKEQILELQDDLHLYRMKLGYLLNKEEEDARRGQK